MGLFILTDLELQTSALIEGDLHEKWKKETCVDIRASA